MLPEKRTLFVEWYKDGAPYETVSKEIERWTQGHTLKLGTVNPNEWLLAFAVTFQTKWIVVNLEDNSSLLD